MQLAMDRLLKNMELRNSSHLRLSGMRLQMGFALNKRNAYKPVYLAPLFNPASPLSQTIDKLTLDVPIDFLFKCIPWIGQRVDGV